MANSTQPLTARHGRRDIGRGVVARPLAVATTTAFLALIGSQMIATLAQGVLPKASSTWVGSVVEALTGPASDQQSRNARVHGAGEALEEDLVDSSWLRSAVRQWGQAVLVDWGGVGNTQVYLGEPAEGGLRWLFFTPATDHLLAPDFLNRGVQQRRAKSASAWERMPQTDPVETLREFAGHLRQRGIHLVVLPAPSKAMVVPGRLAPRIASGSIAHPSYQAFLDLLEDDGIQVVDSLAALSAHETSAPFLVQDSHWTPPALDRVAQATADQVRPVLSPQSRPPRYRRRTLTVSHHGDLVELLGMPTRRTLPEETVEIRPVFSGNRPWRPDPNAEVLLLGDSFANIYSQEALGWGTGAGFAEQLSFHLRRPIDKIVVNAGGAHGSRQAWAHDLATGARSLDNLKVVVYEFAARELSWGDWRTIPIR